MPMKWDPELEKKLRDLVKLGLEDNQIALRMNTTRTSIQMKRRQLLIFKNKTKFSHLSLAERKKRNVDQRRKDAKKHRAKNLEELRIKDKRNKKSRRTLLSINFNKGKRMDYWEYRINQIKNSKRYKVSITASDLENQWIKQNGKCFYSDNDLKAEMPGNQKNKNVSSLVSIDRTNPKLGYEKNNISLISYETNTMKLNMSHQKFVELCRKIGKKH